MGHIRLIFKKLVFFVLIFSLAGFSRVGIISGDTEAERAALEARYAELEKEIEEHTGIIQEKQREATTFERDITILNSQISKSKLGIQARNLSISGLNSGIAECSETVEQLEEKMEEQKVSLSELLRRVNEMDSSSVVEIVLGYDTLSSFFEDFSSYESIQKELQFSLAEIRAIQEETENKKDELENKKGEEVKLKTMQELEKAQLEKSEDQKQYLLKVTKGEEAKYTKLLEEKKQEAAEIKSRIFRLSGGSEALRFDEAVEIAQQAENSVGIRAALILAVLAQESAIDGLIGKNLGQCHYNTPANNRSGTVMSNNQKPSFLAIMEEIGWDPNTTPVSCPIVSDGSYGGAMGPAQFMPTTWWNIENKTGYKKRVAKVTGNPYPSPFSNYEAFVATALYLSDAYDSSACRNYASDYDHLLPYQYLRERCAAAKYYAGGNWWNHRLGYGDSVAERAERFQLDIDIISQ